MKNVHFKGKSAFIKRLLYFGFFLISFNAYSTPTLNILNWDDYISEDVVKGWEDQTGARIRIITYDDEVARDALLTDISQNQIDLAIVDAQSSKKLSDLGYVANLDDPVMRRDIDPSWLDQCGDFAIPYLWGTFGIAYRTDKLKKPVSSWADLFTSRQDLVGHIGMISDYYSLTAPALLTLNLAPNTDKEEDLKQAYEVLKKQADDVLTYEYAPSYLLNSDKQDNLYVAAVYSGDQHSMNDLMGKEVWEYFLPDEGSFVWLDCWIIPSNSEKQLLAKSFLKFIGQAAVAALNSESLGVATVNRKAYLLQSKSFREDDLIYPSEEDFNKLLSFSNLSYSNIRKRTRMLEAVKVIHESK